MMNKQLLAYLFAFAMVCAPAVPTMAQYGTRDDVPAFGGRSRRSGSNDPDHVSASERFYGKAGRSSLSYLSAGYTYDCLDKKHLVEIGVLDFRYKWFGLSPLNFELGVGSVEDRQGTFCSQWLAYRPTVQFYIPLGKLMAISPYGGCAVDCSYLGQYLIRDYEFDKANNYFMDVYGGLSLYFSFIPAIPIELRAEYRHPLVLNERDRINAGAFVSARIHFAKPIGRSR